MTAPQLAERARMALEACTWIIEDPGRLMNTPAENRRALRAALNEALSVEHWVTRLSARLDNELADLEFAALADVRLPILGGERPASLADEARAIFNRHGNGTLHA